MALPFARLSRSEEGLTLVELTITVGLSGVVALGVGAMMHTANKSHRGLALSAEIADISAEIERALEQGATANSSQTPCMQFMRPLGNLTMADAQAGIFPPVDAVRYTITDPPPAVTRTIVAESPDPWNGIRVSRIEFGGPVQVMNRIAGTGVDNTFLIHLYVDFERYGAARPDGAGGVTYEKFPGSPVITKDYPITVVSSTAGVIQNCSIDRRLRVGELCTAIGGDMNPNGLTCNLEPAVCRSLGGTAAGGPFPAPWTCSYPGNSAGTDPVDLAELTCNSIGGSYNSAAAYPNSRCTFPAAMDGRDPDGPVGQREMCSVIGGTHNMAANPRCPIAPPVPTNPNAPTTLAQLCSAFGGGVTGGPGTFRCDFCTASGGIYDPATGNCDLAGRQFCVGNGGIYTPGPGGTPGACDFSTPGLVYVQQNCVALGGTWDGGLNRCMLRPPHAKFGCTNYTLGNIGGGNGDFNPTCNGERYIADISYRQSRNDDADLDGFELTITCCYNSP